MFDMLKWEHLLYAQHNLGYWHEIDVKLKNEINP